MQLFWEKWTKGIKLILCDGDNKEEFFIYKPKFAKNKISLLRLNMSHVAINKLKRTIMFIRKYSKVPICIDTEGAQIRTKIKKRRKYKSNQKLSLYKNKGNFNIYPSEVFDKIKKNDFLNIGFDGLEVKVIKVTQNILSCRVINGGMLENNKGIHLTNRNIKLNFITEKDWDIPLERGTEGAHIYSLSCDDEWVWFLTNKGINFYNCTTYNNAQN